MAKKKTSGKFPLFLHSSGQWAKKIRGRTRYFGTIKDEALKEYVRVREDLEAGRVTRPRSDQAISMADLCNSFLTSKRQRVDSGELSGRIWSEYHKACEMIVDQFGRDRSVMDLRPSDFGKLRNRFTKRLGPFAVAKSIQCPPTVAGTDPARLELRVWPKRLFESSTRDACRQAGLAECPAPEDRSCASVPALARNHCRLGRSKCGSTQPERSSRLRLCIHHETRLPLGKVPGSWEGSPRHAK